LIEIESPADRKIFPPKRVRVPALSQARRVPNGSVAASLPIASEKGGFPYGTLLSVTVWNCLIFLTIYAFVSANVLQVNNCMASAASEADMVGLAPHPKRGWGCEGFRNPKLMKKLIEGENKSVTPYIQGRQAAA
jgi:hypothetical protein